jgi:diguanylate cyclase (GGDEF)-like protein
MSGMRRPASRYGNRAVAWCVVALVLMLVAIVAPLAHAQAPLPVVELGTGSGRAELAGRVQFLVDPDDRLAVADLRSAAYAHQFRPLPRLPATFGFASGTFWLHWRVTNRDHPAPDWVVAVRYALLDVVELTVVRPDGGMQVMSSGDLQPFTERALAHRHPNFLVALMPGDSADFYLRVRSQSSIQLPLEMLTSEAFLAASMPEHLGLGLYYGIMLGLFFYNLILFASTRDRTFLYYVIYVGLFSAGQFALNGLAFQYLWPQFPLWANTAVLALIGLGLLAMLAFTRSFLGLRRQYPRADRVLHMLSLVLLVAIAAMSLVGYRRTILIETGLVFVIAAAILWAAIGCLRRGYRPARHFLLAWIALLVGVVAYASVSFGLLPKMFITEYGIQIGSAAEMILLSFALAYRINLLRSEYERVQADGREQLESRVAERTRELDTAMQQLRNANMTLAERSLRDGLTGSWNRRWLDQSLPDAWLQARACGQPLTLAMVDLDHFKQINDRHGHMVGDDCLRAVARCLDAQRANGRERVVRYGGEEFVLLMPDVAANAAASRAERIRMAIADLRVHSEGIGLNVTVSIGIATFDASATIDADELLRRADLAMYEAKRDGRNRAVARALGASVPDPELAPLRQ